MPTAPPTICTEPGCGTFTTTGRCEQHRLAYRRADSGRASSHTRGYDRAWQATRAAYLEQHPYCECDEHAAMPTYMRPIAIDVDHRDNLGPHGPAGHDPSNLQALTHACHSRKTAAHDGSFGRPRRNLDSRDRDDRTA